MELRLGALRVAASMPTMSTSPTGSDGSVAIAAITCSQTSAKRRMVAASNNEVAYRKSARIGDDPVRSDTETVRSNLAIGAAAPSGSALRPENSTRSISSGCPPAATRV